jgi:putative tricarboxylic transport membrane protein
MSDVTSGGLSKSPEGYGRYDFYGGLTLAVLGAILFATSFLPQTPVPLVVQGSIVVFTAVGLAVAFYWLPVKNQQDFYGGMGLILLALTAFVASNDLPGMRGFAFGPGTAPRLFAFTLIVLSLGVVVGGLLIDGPKITRYNLRGIIFILGSILSFAAAIRPLGLIIATFSSLLICAAATPDIRWRETVIWAAILTAFCTFLFPYGLNLPFQLWPRWFV